MNRDEFLKTLAISAGVAVITPSVLRGVDLKPGEKNGIAIEIDSISGIISGGKKLSPSEVLDLYLETGILIYNSHGPDGVYCQPPTVIKGQVEVVDVSKLK